MQVKISLFKYVEPEKQLPFKGKCFINVKSYAEKYGILMDKAHEEIQLKLFELGYSWAIKVKILSSLENV